MNFQEPQLPVDFSERYPSSTGKDQANAGSLMNAINTGCYFSHNHRPTFPVFTDKIATDIKTMVNDNPGLLQYDGGLFRCRRGVTPLMAACINKNIPMEIIEFFLERGADPDVKINVSEQETSFIEDLESNISLIDKDRLEKIRQLFKKYTKEDLG
ncbi:MAG: ankyrin repeat domain-containing protein [Chlamydiota bacterium]